jgi:hypothetical protein
MDSAARKTYSVTPVLFAMLRALSLLALFLSPVAGTWREVFYTIGGFGEPRMDTNGDVHEVDSMTECAALCEQMQEGPDPCRAFNYNENDDGNLCLTFALATYGIAVQLTPDENWVYAHKGEFHCSYIQFCFPHTSHTVPIDVLVV